MSVENAKVTTSDLVMGRVQELLSVSGSFDYEERWSGRSDY